MFDDSVDQIKYSTTPTHLYHHFQNKRYAIRSWLKWGVVTILKGFLIFWMNWNQFFVMMCYIYMACKFSTHPNWIIVRFIYLYMAVQFLLQFYGCCFLIQLSSAEFEGNIHSLQTCWAAYWYFWRWIFHIAQIYSVSSLETTIFRQIISLVRVNFRSTFLSH